MTHHNRTHVRMTTVHSPSSPSAEPNPSGVTTRRGAPAARPPWRGPCRAGSRGTAPARPAAAPPPAPPRRRGCAPPAARRCGPADRHGRHRHPRRHLHDREQRVHPVEVLQRHRHADHRQRGDRREHPRQVRGAPGAGDDHPQPARLGRARRTRPSPRGIRCAETTSTSQATPNSSSATTAASMTGQSESDPMTTPTTGVPPVASAACSLGHHSLDVVRRVPGPLTQVGEVVAADVDVPDLAARAARPCRTCAPSPPGRAP